MKLGYSNYGMKDVDIVEALPRIRSIGYEAIEICARDGWQTVAGNFGPPERKELSAKLQEVGFPTPPIMEALDVCAAGDARAAMLRRAEATFELANDLNLGDGPSIVTTTVGDPNPDWDTGKCRVRDGFMELADLAGRHNVIVAAEPHAGSNFNTPEKAAWLMENTRHDHLKLNFDISHFVAQGIDMGRSIDICVPYAVHTHIKDGYTSDGNVHYLLPGDGQMSLGRLHGLRDTGRSGSTNLRRGEPATFRTARLRFVENRRVLFPQVGRCTHGGRKVYGRRQSARGLKAVGKSKTGRILIWDQRPPCIEERMDDIISAAPGYSIEMCGSAEELEVENRRSGGRRHWWSFRRGRRPRQRPPVDAHVERGCGQPRAARSGQDGRHLHLRQGQRGRDDGRVGDDAHAHVEQEGHSLSCSA